MVFLEGTLGWSNARGRPGFGAAGAAGAVYDRASVSRSYLFLGDMHEIPFYTPYPAPGYPFYEYSFYVLVFLN